MLANDCPVRPLSDLLGCLRSSYCYQPKLQGETEVKIAVEGVVAEWPTYGYRRVTKRLYGPGWRVNKKRVHRLLRKMGLLVKTKREARKATNGEHDFPRYPNLVQNLEVVHPDQVGVSDITYIRLCEGVRVLGRGHGRVRTQHPWLAPGVRPRSHLDPDRLGSSLGRRPSGNRRLAEICVKTLDPQNQRRLTVNDWEWDKHPSWSPDGHRIAFYSSRGNSLSEATWQIWVMDVVNDQGVNLRNLSNRPDQVDTDPVWFKWDEMP